MPQKDISGWGSDRDPASRPAVPKERTPPREIQPAWLEPEQQLPVEGVLHSNERPRLSRVYGTSVPDGQGLVSSRLRWLAFRFSENDLRHWLILLAADRVDVVEGVFEDLLRLKVPNPFAEMGWKAEFKHAPLRGAAKVAGLGLAAALGVLALRLLKPRPRGLARLFR
jgi:hypothetical protein